MLGFRILIRAVSQIYLHWKYAIFIGLPWVIILTAASLPRYFYDLHATPPDVYALHFPPILPYPWALAVYILGLFILVMWGGISIAIGWHRTLLIPEQTVRDSLHSQPRLHYFLRGFGIVALAALPALLISEYASYLLLQYWYFNIETYQGFSLFWSRVETFSHEYASQYLITLFSTLIGLSLAGVAISDKPKFLASAGYGLRHGLHIFVAVSLLYLAYFLLQENIDLYQFKLEYHSGITTPWLLLPFRILIAWLYLMISIAIVTEFYRDMTKRAPKNAASDTSDVFY